MATRTRTPKRTKRHAPPLVRMKYVGTDPSHMADAAPGAAPMVGRDHENFITQMGTPASSYYGKRKEWEILGLEEELKAEESNGN